MQKEKILNLEIKNDRVYTQKDYKDLPHNSPYQLINGKLIGSPAPVPYHQIVLRNIVSLIWNFIQKNDLGEVLFSPIDVYLEEKEAYQPDIIFISKQRLSIIKEDGIYGVPDLVIEILSLSTAYFDLRHKKEIYQRCGVKEYWIVDPQEKSIEIYQNKENKFELIEYKKEKGIIKSYLLNIEINLENIF